MLLIKHDGACSGWPLRRRCGAQGFRAERSFKDTAALGSGATDPRWLWAGSGWICGCTWYVSPEYPLSLDDFIEPHPFLPVALVVYTWQYFCSSLHRCGRRSPRQHRTYVPHVHCSAPRPGGLAPGSCQKVLEAMPISNLRTEFIEAGQRTASDQVVVPRIFDSSQFVVLLA